MIEPQPEEIKNARGLIHIATVREPDPSLAGEQRKFFPTKRSFGKFYIGDATVGKVCGLH